MVKPMKKSYTYDAFISYRHTEPDKFVAETLHRELESYKLPRSVRNKTNGRQRIRRVFRDRDELPLAANLEDPIREALENSEYLIVICSPRLKESMWCRKEIETFIELNGRERVFAVLVEGEPADSFPEQLLYREQKFVGDDGVERTIKIPMEPLAADVRGANRGEMKKAIKQEVLRLMAPMFDLNYDDLKQRHRERRMKRILAAVTGIAAVGLIFGTVSTTMALRIQKQKTQIEAQNEEIVTQNQEITAKNIEITAKNEEISLKNEEIQKQNDSLALSQALALAEESARKLEDGDRVGAVEAACEALTGTGGTKLPYTASAQYALTEALYAYSTGDKYQPVFQLETAGLIDEYLVSPEGTKLICGDNTNTYYLFDLQTGETLQKFYDGKALSSGTDNYCFPDEKRLLYLNAEGGVTLYDLETEEKTVLNLDEGIYSLLCKGTGRKLWAKTTGGILIYETDTFTRVGQIDKPEGEMVIKIRAVNETDTACVLNTMGGEGEFLYLVNWETGTMKRMELGDRYPGEARFMEGSLYVNLNEMELESNWYQAHVYCFREEDWSEKWHISEERALGRFLRLTGEEVSDDLLFCTGTEALILNRYSGEMTQRYVLSSEPVQAFAYRSSDLFSLICRNGDMVSIQPSKNQCYVMNTIFTSCSDNLKTADVVAGGFVDMAHSTKRLTCYKQCPGEGLQPYGGSVEEVSSSEENLLYQSAAAYGQEKGLPDAALIDEIFFAKEEDLGFARYRDNRFLVFRESDGTVLSSTLLESSTVNRFFGKDQAGNLYVGGYGLGYILNSSYEKIACVEAFRGLLPEENQVIIMLRDQKLYTLPILTVEDLLAQGSKVVLK